MFDSYDPPHPDGPVDPEDVPGPPLGDGSWDGDGGGEDKRGGATWDDADFDTALIGHPL